MFVIILIAFLMILDCQLGAELRLCMGVGLKCLRVLTDKGYSYEVKLSFCDVLNLNLLQIKQKSTTNKGKLGIVLSQHMTNVKKLKSKL